LELTAIWTEKGAPARQKETAARQAQAAAELRECELLLRRNEMLFNLESDEALIDCRIYEREALLARHAYLVRVIRAAQGGGD